MKFPIKGLLVIQSALIVLMLSGYSLAGDEISSGESTTVKAAPCETGSCESTRTVTRSVTKKFRGLKLLPFEVNRNREVYEHAKREATILANKGRVFHPLGTARGCRMSGTGCSTGTSPRHCFSSLPGSRIVARACVVRNGRRYWSCHYR